MRFCLIFRKSDVGQSVVVYRSMFADDMLYSLNCYTMGDCVFSNFYKIVILIYGGNKLQTIQKRLNRNNVYLDHYSLFVNENKKKTRNFLYDNTISETQFFQQKNYISLHYSS